MVVYTFFFPVQEKCRSDGKQKRKYYQEMLLGGRHILKQSTEAPWFRALYEQGQILTEGISLIFGREIPFSFEP